MNQITGASQSAASTLPQNLPPESFAQLGPLSDALAPPIPGQTPEQWLEQARTTANPVLRAFYNELVTLAGGRTDPPALFQVLKRFQALQNAAAPGAAAGTVQAAERGWLDQITTMLSRFDPLNNLLNAVQPHLADMTRAAGLGETAWGASLQRVLDAPGSAAAFNDGLRAGIIAGGKDMIVGTAGTVGGLLQYGADTSLAGRAGDAVRGLTGPLTGVLDTMTPSAARGAATSEKLADMGGRIGDYLGAVADDPARLKTDIANTINAQWDSLKADHAAAAARGPQEEARWWGETVGRVSFEVVATFVPVTKAGTVAKAANGAADLAQAVNRADGAAAAAVRAGDTVTGGAPIAGRTDGAGGATRATGAADEIAARADEAPAPAARALDKFDEIAAKAKIDMPHILDGHLNKKGHAVGFHSRPDGIDPPSSRMTHQVGLTTPEGVYVGKVEVLDPATGNWVPKRANNGESTFYPDRMSAKDIEAAVRHAYADALRTGQVRPDGKFVGRTGDGFQVEGYVRNNQITTAYPKL